MTPATPDPTHRLGNYLVCAVCARPGTGHGWAPPPSYGKQPPIAWLCDDPACVQIAKDTYSMRQEKFARVDSLAAGQGGEVAGQWLEEMGLEDVPMSQMPIEHWLEFWRRGIAGYRVALTTTLSQESPF